MTSRSQMMLNRFLGSKTHLSIERTKLHTDSMKSSEGEPQIIRQAKALANILKGISVTIYPDELVVGSVTDKVRGAMVYPEAHDSRIVPELEELKTRDCRVIEVTQEDISAMQEEIASYWTDASLIAQADKKTPEKIMETLYAGSVFILTEVAGFGHLSINYPMLFSMGFEKFNEIAEKRIDEYSGTTDTELLNKIDFYKAAKIVADAIIQFANRYSKSAVMLAQDEKDFKRKAELERIAEICQWVPAKPPRNLHEAIQFIRFTHLALTIETYDGQAISMGRIDQYLQPFYENDIKSGKLTKEGALELVEMLWIKTNEHVPAFDSFTGMYFEGLLTTQAATIGGIDEEGFDATNEMTYLILQATKNIGLPLPNVHVRIHQKSPSDLMGEIATVVASGANNIAIFNDEVIVKAWKKQGISEEEARNYATVGCVELAPFGNSFTSSDAALFNLAMCLELALNNGETLLLGAELGLKTGDPLKWQSIDDVIQAFQKQVSYLVGLMAEGSNSFEQLNMDMMPTPLLSLCVEDCFEKGRDITSGSAKYNFTGVQGVGMADVADSLAAIDQIVFREKKVSMHELIVALRDGFEDQESLRQLLQNRAPKYGNDEKFVDDYAQLVSQIYSEEVEKHKNIRGGAFIPGMYSVTTHVAFGLFTGALPSGRLPSTPLSNGVSPVILAPSKGLTAVLNSVTSIDYTLYPNGVAFTLALDPTFVEGKDGSKSLISILKSYVELGGMHIQFNLIDPETLLEAQTNPSSYRNLLVRVAGYSAYFVDLGETVQNEIIGRFQKSIH
ncbi:MAG: glycyl radical protein [Candidatus Thorarchaeota archaeon]